MNGDVDVAAAPWVAMLGFAQFARITERQAASSAAVMGFTMLNVEGVDNKHERTLGLPVAQRTPEQATPPLV